jgi:hypothetical protein
MSKLSRSSVNRIVVPAPAPSSQPILPKFVGDGHLPIPRLQAWAPAWFYSALHWLNKSYLDAGSVPQRFCPYLAGSDVNPYTHLGSTQLFMIFSLEDTFRLTIALDTNSTASTSGGTSYPKTDAGITQMYTDLAASPIFPAVKYCYIPGRLGSDLNPNVDEASFAVFARAGLGTGYDPATGMRSVVLGSAVSQVVPIEDFIKTPNQQIYNDSPAIVPFVAALVYDVSQYNTPGASTFVLPVLFTRDQVSPGNYYVNKFEATATVNGADVHCGQSVLFPGGPGYSDAVATSLKLGSSAQSSVQGHTVTTYNFDLASVVTISTLSPKVQTGIFSLTFSAPSPLAVFSNQQIIGFYRDSSWKTSLGVPIYDYGTQNGSFTAASQPLSAPALVYDPTNPFLNGGSLQNVVQKLAQASYLYPTDRLVSILDTAIAAKNTDSGAGLAVTAAALDFNMSSTPAAPAVDQLGVPVVVTATTTPPPPVILPSQGKALAPAGPGAAPLPVAVNPAIPARAIDILAVRNLEQIIGSGSNNPSQSQPAPVTVQVALTASMPREVLIGTGITTVEIGTSFPEQSLGDGATFESETAGTALNLMDRHGKVPPFPPYDLALGSASVNFTAGVYYVLSLTGTNLTVRGSDGSSASSVLTVSGTPDPSHTFVGAMVDSDGVTTVRLYPKLQLSLPAPSVGTHGVLQGEAYSVRLTFGDANSQYDIVDSTQTTVDSDISVPNPKPTDGSSPQQGDMYFGSFIGGSSQMTVWSVPVFLSVAPSQLPGASYNGPMTLDAQTSGVPGYQLQITDSSLFVYSNINVDSGSIGSLSSNKVFLASAVISSSPDDLTSKAFAPCRLLAGLVRQAQMGTVLKYVFIPSDDSVVIGNTRYMLSVINLDNLDFDPNSLPYPPVFWPDSQLWQFANRHNPYHDVEYTGATQDDRISRTQVDTARIGLETAHAQEPMHMYLDTGGGMTVWPIYAFPFATVTQAVDQGQLKAITNTILQILSTQFPAKSPLTPSPLDGEQVTIPAALQQNNPYTTNAATVAGADPTVNSSISAQTIESSVSGLEVTNLSPDFVANTSIHGIPARNSFKLLENQKAAAGLAVTKSLAPQIEVSQARDTVAAAAESVAFRRQYQPIYGFSVYNSGTGEAYIVEVVATDLKIPDQLPQPTQNVTYDPYYVRVVFLNTLTCYQMSIIVPSMVYDQFGHLAKQSETYRNLLSKTNELGIGYLYSLYDGSNNFDSLDFTPYPPDFLATLFESQSYLYTNVPYSTQQNVSFSPLSLFGQFSLGAGSLAAFRANAAVPERLTFNPSLIAYNPFATPPAYFICRRKNWSADCHLMQATQPAGKSIYLAFGGGDLVPFRLDNGVTVDKRQPAHMYKLTYTFSDKQYDSAKTISIGNKPYVVAVTTQGSVTQYVSFSINAMAGTADLQISNSQPLNFPTEIYVVGQASATLTSIATINSLQGTAFNTTGDFITDAGGSAGGAEFQVIPYNNLVYLVRAVSNIPALGVVGGTGVQSGLLVDTFVPSATGNLALAQAARYKRSGLSFFGNTYTPSTMVDTLDTLDFTSITGETFYAPTIFIPIPELDAGTGFVADLSDFLGQQIWTLIYPEIVAQPGETVNGVTYPNGYNLDVEGKPVLSLQKLHFVYDPLVVMFTPNDLTHKYQLQPKQQVLALTNGQIQEGICWRSANLQPQRLPPTNICAQQILPAGDGMDRPNIIYSSHNRAVETSIGPGYKGMSVNSFLSVSGIAYNIEESAQMMTNDQTASGLISAVSTVSNMLIGVLFDYDNNDLGTLVPYDPAQSTKGIVFLNGYLGPSGYSFSSPDHFDVNDVLPSQVPLLEQIAALLGQDFAFNNVDVSLPRQFWSLVYDSFTAQGLPNFIPNVPPSLVDPTFSNRTRSLILSLQNPVRPTALGLMDTYSSVVSANIHLENGVTGSVFLSKKADRDVASIGSNPSGSATLSGLPTKYDFFIFSRDHYWTLKGATFELIDQGYAMCLVDDGTGTGTQVAKYYIDTDGNYNELYTYALFSPNGGILESASFILKVTLGAPANLSATPVIPETPNNVNPQDLVAQINKVSNLIFAAFGPSTPGQPPAFLPIQVQSAPSGIQAAPILGPPGFNGYSLNVVGAGNRQPMQISQIYSGNQTYSIAGPTTIIPINPKTGKAVSFFGSLSHGLDEQVPVPLLQSTDLTSYIPRPTVPPGPASGVYGGNGQGSLVATQFSCAFQGSGAIPPAVSGGPAPGTIMKADDTIFYTFNAVTNTVMDSTGKSATVSGGQYFIDATDPNNPIFAVLTLPKFTLNQNTYAVNLSTTLADGVTSRYSLVAGGKSYLFGPDNAHVTVDRTIFTFNPLKGGSYTVTYASIDDPAGSEAPSPISLTPFSIAAGGKVATIDVFNNPGGLSNIVLGITGRQYTYDPVHGTVTIIQGANQATVPVQTGMTFASNSQYGYVVGFQNGAYTVNGGLMFPYSASTTGAPPAYPLMTSPQIFTIGGNFYTFDQANGAYVSVTGNGQTYPINPYQFSINGVVYIINTNVQPNTVVGGGNIYNMTAGNTQFLLNGVQYTVTLKSGSLNGATISGQFNITQGNVVVTENYVYQLDTLNGQIVGNGTAYPLTTSGFTYTITTADRSFTVTTEPNAATVTIGNIDYLINNTTVVGDGVTYPILPYRTFVDGATTFNVGLDGIVYVSPPFTLSGSAPFTRATFTDGVTYTVNDIAAFDGTSYYLISGSPGQFATATLKYTLRTDGVAITAGAVQTYIVNPTGPLSPNQFTFGTKTVFFARSSDLAAFDGSHYYAISNGQFTDSNTGLTYTLSGNTAVHEGNSYEVFSNLGQNPFFEVPGGPTYYVNIPVADFGSASGDIFSVFPVTSGQFAIPLVYTVTVSGSAVTVDAVTFSGPTAAPTLTASGGNLTGGFFQDPVTNIVYTCAVDAGVVTFIDSNNAVYPYPAAGSTGTFVASVLVITAVNLAVDNEPTPAIYPIVNNQFAVGTTTYKVNVPVAYQNAAGPYWQMVNGRFIVPRTFPQSNVSYTVRGAKVTKGYVISADDEFAVDGNVVYTVNEVNVVRATNQATLSGTEPNQTLTSGALTYALNTTTSLASIQPAGLNFNTGTKQLSVTIGGVAVTYSVTPTSVTDSRNPTNVFPATLAGSQLTFTDTVAGITFTFDDSGNNPITAEFAYTNHFFVDVINGITYYIDEADNKVEAISYLPETTQYAFVPGDGNTYLIHYSDVSVVFPVISGANVNVGVATVGSDIFTLHADQVTPSSGGASIPINLNSFEINGNLYSIIGTPTGSDYSACQVVGAAMAAKNFTGPNTFKLGDPTITYTLQLDSGNLPAAVQATFAVKPSRDLIVVNDNVYVITYNTVSTGTLLGQGQASIAITNSSFTLSNPFDSTKAKFIFADLNIFDAASVVGQFTVYLAPTFFIGAATYTLDPVNLVVTDNNKRPFPLIPNPIMFGINGFNYVIDTNRVPHAIIGNNNVSPIATDVTVQKGMPIPNSTFTLNGQVYAYIEDAQHNLLAITGTKSYMVSQPALTFKLDSSLIFTISTTPPKAGNFAGSVVPIGTVTAASVTLNLYAGTPESGKADYFMYKNVLYTLVKSGGIYEAVQKSYTVYVASPATNQQQLAVFDLNGSTYIVTDGTTAGAATPAGINPGTMWSQTATSSSETQFGLVYGFTPQPTNVSQSALGVFQFQTTDSNGNNVLYDLLYTPKSSANEVKVDLPNLLPTFMQSGPFTFTTSYPLTFETGGYNAFTTFVSETNTPSESFSAAYRTPVVSTDSQVDQLISAQGDFSLEFWHSLPPLSEVPAYHPFTYTASTPNPLVYDIDVDFENTSDIYVRINQQVMHASATPPVFSSGWRHFALTYAQPYVMLLQGAGFAVKEASNLNFSRDFSIAITFSATDVDTPQGLVYKGTGSPNTPPELSMSYRVGISGKAVTLDLVDGAGNPASFSGAAVLQPNTFYQVIIVKQATSPAANPSGSGNPDPFAPPFDSSDMGQAAQSGGSFNISALPSGGGPVTVSGVKPVSAPADLQNFLTNISNTPTKSYSVTISVRQVQPDGTYTEPPTATTKTKTVNDDTGLFVNSTGSAHLMIGSMFDDNGVERPFGALSSNNTGNIRDVYLFNGAINSEGINTASGSLVNISGASSDDLLRAGILGFWKAQYDPNGVVNNPYDANAVALSASSLMAYLAPLSGYELEATSLYINGYPMALTLVQGSDVPSSMPDYTAGSSLLNFNAGLYRLQELSFWAMERQAYQIIDDMFGRLVPSNEPFLAVYLSGSFTVPPSALTPNPPFLPLNAEIDNTGVSNLASLKLSFFPASLDLQGCPAVGRCGPLVTSNLYTPPGIALTVCDTPPSLTTYSVTLNSVTGALAGEVNEAYVYIKDNVLTLYAGKKVGDLVLSWVSQEQGDVQLIGYIEGAPPCPMANLTNKPGTNHLEPNTVYPGATSITFTTPTTVSLKYQLGNDSSDETTWSFKLMSGLGFLIATNISPVGFGVHLDALKADAKYPIQPEFSTTTANGSGYTTIADNKLVEAHKYTVKMEGTFSPFTGDQFMASLNTLTTPSNTPGNSSTKTAILPNPNLGGFTTSNPPGALPKTAPTEEKFGQRMYVPSPYGQAFVTSETLDVYQQTLVQTNTVYGFVRVPNPQIPRDLNIVSFRMSSKYIRPGCLDGVVNYVYNPATLPNGSQTYTTSTGQMQVLYDGNFSPGEVGHNASYMRIVEAYQLKKKIDQEALNAIAIYQSAYNTQDSPTDSSLTPSLDFYNEYVWSSRGGTQEVKHTYTTSLDEVYTTSTVSTQIFKLTFNVKLIVFGYKVLDLDIGYQNKSKDTIKYTYQTTGSTSFDIGASFDGIETDTQMRYACNNDAHFVMNFNSTFNPNNQSGLNLVIGSDGLVYKIVPSVTSGAGLPLSDNVDTSQAYMQPQPAYASGNADGPSGNLEPYDRPGKTSIFRTYAFFLQPASKNNDDFWNTVVDQTWLNNSPDPDAAALRTAQGKPSIPWRLLYRVTYSQRFPAPVSTEAIVVPQITPVMAVPVLNPASDFLFRDITLTPRPAHNPANDIEANVVLAAPTASGLSAGSVPRTGPSAGKTILPNNVIPFDLVKGVSSIVNWGDTANVKLMTQLTTSVLGLNTVTMSPSVPLGSTKVADVLDPASGGPLYSIYIDPNGLTANVPVNSGITVYQDVNSNPVQYYDGKTFHSLQADYVASPDGTVMYYVQPPSTYDQSSFDLLGDYDLYGHPGDEWRYYLVSGASANMTSEPAVAGTGPFLISTGAAPYTGFSIASSQHDSTSGVNQVKGYVLVQGIMQWPNLNTNAETFADVGIFKAMSLLDTFPIGDPVVLISFLKAQYAGAPLVANDEINLVFAKNIVSYFNTLQQGLIPQ